MPFFRSLIRRAVGAAEIARGSTERLKNEIAELEQRKSKAQAEFALAKSAVERLDHFEPDIDGDLQCPDCWVSRGVRSTLIPIASDTGIDWFRCKTCHLEISVE